MSRLVTLTTSLEWHNIGNAIVTTVVAAGAALRWLISRYVEWRWLRL